MDTEEVPDILKKTSENGQMKSEGYSCPTNSHTKTLDKGLQANLNVKLQLPSTPNDSNSSEITTESGMGLDLTNTTIKSERDIDVYSNDNMRVGNEKVVIKQEFLTKMPTSSNNFSSDTKLLDSSYFTDSQPKSESFSFSYWNVPIKEEVEDVNPDVEVKSEVEEEMIDNGDRAMLPMENGCTNSDCNLQKQCLQKYRCHKCNLIFTKGEILAAHLKTCQVVILPLIETTISLATQEVAQKYNEYEYGTNEKKLIENVKKHSCLYNIHNKDYNNTQLTDSVWANVASECNFPNGAAAKIAWQKLKDSFLNQLQEQNNVHNRQTAKPTKPWKYQKQMEFLLPHVTNRHATNKRAVNEVTNQARENPAVGENNQNDVSTEQSFVSSAKKQKVTSSSNSEAVGVVNINQRNKESQTKVWSRLREPKARASTSSQPLDMFFMSMCETTKNLPPPLQLQIKRKVFKAVIEAEEAAATETTDSGTNNLPHTSSSTRNEHYMNNSSQFSAHSLTTVIDDSSSSQDD